MEKDSPRKRPRENETPSQRLKREKAAERQRRKRERDRAASGLGPPPMPFPSPPVHDAYGAHPQTPDYLPQPPAHAPQHDSELSPDEQARRERVRAAARERQRKHRQLVKQRKMRELGLDMGNDIMGGGPGMEEVHYRVGADGQYQQVLPHDLATQQAHQHLLVQAAQQQHAAAQQQGRPRAGGAAISAGRSATTLLLSFSCAPLLKQHLLRTLNMTNDELASLEPVIAEAWDRWDQGRRGIRYDHPDGFQPPGAPISMPTAGQPPFPGPPPPQGYPGPPPPGAADDFRGRFQRAVIVPAPFHGQDPSAFPNPNGAEYPNGTEGEGEDGEDEQSGDAIDPHLSAQKDELKDEE
ncbi:hypothetical protein MVEN_02266700 [Mycena venus]|uniref:Uncharacterized protein n=1 Tax=Mycena venus TaxID=2733690 RepID=A0A8H7CG97_9AGAR|nr:hypothetical protein MVEN_02266700 [Mycena venus]